MWHGRAAVKRHYRLCWIILAGALNLLALSLLLRDFQNNVAVLILPVATIYSLFARKYLIKIRTRRRFKKDPNQNQEITWTIAEESFQIKTKDSESKSTWNQIVKIRKTGTGYLLYPNPRIFYWIPFSAFEQEHEHVWSEEVFRKVNADFKEVK